jgi:hypothetical protein
MLTVCTGAARVAEARHRRQNECAASASRRCKLSIGADVSADEKISEFRQVIVLKD